MKNGDFSVTSISISMLGHSPISSLRLNASLYLCNKSLTCVFSTLVKHELSKFIYLSKISPSIIYFLLSVSSNKGIFLQNFLLHSSSDSQIYCISYIHHLLIQHGNVCLNVLGVPLALFYRSLMMSNLQFLPFLSILMSQFCVCYW